MYAIRTTGGLQSVERVEPAPVRCAAVEAAARSAGRDDVDGVPLMDPRKPEERGLAAERSGLGGAASTESAAHPAGDDVVDVLVLYPSFVREIEGGYGQMLDIIDLDIATANEALAASGADLRLGLAAAVEVEYDWFLDEALKVEEKRHFAVRYELWGKALEHLAHEGDGYLDETRTLRDRHAADLVLLHLGGDAHQFLGDYSIGGNAWWLSSLSRDEVERHGFAVARSGHGLVVAHELGHSMGLAHERSDTSRGLLPYSHGFRYVAPESRERDYEWWNGTIMSSVRDISDVPLFSNPDLVHPDDPGLRLGVPGDEPTTSPDGPADAVRHLNEVRHIVANVRPRSDADTCRYDVSGDDGLLPAEGGAYRLRVETGAGCTWQASGGEWVESVAPAGGAGSGEIEYRVAANHGFERPVEVLAAGRVHARRQAGSRPIKPICERSGFWWHILSRHPDYNNFDSRCEANAQLADASFLASLRQIGFMDFVVDYPKYGPLDGSELRPGDFDGLTGLVSLHLENIESLPADLFSGLIGLRTLQLSYAWQQREPRTLRNIEPGAFRGLPGLRGLYINGHLIRTFETGTFEGMPRLKALEVSGRGPNVWGYPATPPTVTTIEPGAMAGLVNLRALRFIGHRMDGLPAGMFDGIGGLEALYLSDNGLVSLPPGILNDLGGLETLDLDSNELVSLAPDIFGGLGKLRSLYLRFNRLETLPAGIFDGLANLEFMSLWANRLERIEPGLFRGLGSLERLNLAENHHLDGPLRADAFDGLDGLIMLSAPHMGITALEPGVFDVMPRLRFLNLIGNNLLELPPGVFEGLVDLEALFLGANPGAPFTFAPGPVRIPDSDPPARGRPATVGVGVPPGAPLDMRVDLTAQGGSLDTGGGRLARMTLPTGSVRGGRIAVTPAGDGPVTVRVAHVDGPPQTTANPCPILPKLTISVGGGAPGAPPVGPRLRDCYSGVRLAPGPPLVLYGIGDRELAPGRGPETIDLADVFSHFLGADAEFAASSGDESVATVEVVDGTLTVTPVAAGTATVAVTATGADGETLSRGFGVTVRAPRVPLLPSASVSASAPGRGGFVRLVNHSGRSGVVRVTAVDDRGARRGPVTLEVAPHAVAHFNSGDLERGGGGLGGGVGAGTGDWRLEFESALEIGALAYVRSHDGYVASLHDVAPEDGDGHHVGLFIPGGGPSRASRLRVVNPGRRRAEVEVRGVDDAGGPLGGVVRFGVPPGAALTLTEQQLRAGAAWLDGALEDGEGWWRLRVVSDEPVSVMNLLENTRTGLLSNLSSGPVVPAAEGGAHHVPLFPAASRGLGQRGLVRVVNRSPRAGVVRIDAFDDAGTRRGPLELAVVSGGASHLDSEDLELGNAALGLSGSAGAGEGDWRLELTSDLDIAVYAYVRARDGFLTAMHDVVAPRDGRVAVPMLNPGSNGRQTSRLRLVNPHPEAVWVAIAGTDDRGRTPPQWPRGVDVEIPGRGALTMTAAELEAGVPSDSDSVGLVGLFAEPFVRWPLGYGTGKWRLTVSVGSETWSISGISLESHPLIVMSLLESPTGHLTNLSTAPGHGMSVLGEH